MQFNTGVVNILCFKNVDLWAILFLWTLWIYDFRFVYQGPTGPLGPKGAKGDLGEIGDQGPMVMQ